MRLPATTMLNYRDDSPQILCDFLSYHETIKAHSQKTVDEYYLDLRNFFRYMKRSRDRSLSQVPLNEISILDIDIEFIRTITLTDIYGYLSYLSRDRAQRHNSPNTDYGLSATTRARKIATLRSFFNYLATKVHLFVATVPSLQMTIQAIHSPCTRARMTECSELRPKPRRGVQPTMRPDV